MHIFDVQILDHQLQNKKNWNQFEIQRFVERKKNENKNGCAMKLTAVLGLLANWSQTIWAIIWIVCTISTIPIVRTWSIWTVWCHWWKDTINIAPAPILFVYNRRIKWIIAKCFAWRLRIACPASDCKCCET